MRQKRCGQLQNNSCSVKLLWSHSVRCVCIKMDGEGVLKVTFRTPENNLSSLQCHQFVPLSSKLPWPASPQHGTWCSPVSHTDACLVKACSTSYLIIMLLLLCFFYFSARARWVEVGLLRHIGVQRCRECGQEAPSSGTLVNSEHIFYRNLLNAIERNSNVIESATRCRHFTTLLKWSPAQVTGLRQSANELAQHITSGSNQITDYYVYVMSCHLWT